MTDVFDNHTRPTGSMNLLVSSAAITHGQLLQISFDVISDTAVQVPVRVHPVLRCSEVGRLLLHTLVGFIVALLALPGWMAHLGTNLALDHRG